MKAGAGCLITTLIFCIFMGVFAVSMGLGAVVPRLNLVAKPLVCPDGEMEFETDVRRRKNFASAGDHTHFSATAFCVDSDGDEREELGMFPMVLYSGLVYGLALFLLAFIALKVLGGRVTVQQQPGPRPPGQP